MKPWLQKGSGVRVTAWKCVPYPAHVYHCKTETADTASQKQRSDAPPRTTWQVPQHGHTWFQPSVRPCSVSYPGIFHPEPSVWHTIQRWGTLVRTSSSAAGLVSTQTCLIFRHNTALKNTCLWKDEKESYLQQPRVRAGQLMGRQRGRCLRWRCDLHLRNTPCFYRNNSQAASVRETTFFRFWNKSGEKYSDQRLSAVSGHRLWVGRRTHFPAKFTPSHW